MFPGNAPSEGPPVPGVEEVVELFGVEVEELFELNASVGELLEGSLPFDGGFGGHFFLKVFLSFFKSGLKIENKRKLKVN